MASLPSSLSSALPQLLHLHRRSLVSLSIPSRATQNLRKFPRLVLNCSASSFDDLTSPGNFSSKGSSKKSVLTSFIQEIEPLDVSLIQKDVPLTTVDAMKRTISSMLGLLPSDQFHVSIEALWEPLSKLLVSSMVTGYTLRNAEYKLCVEKNFDVHEENFQKTTSEDSRVSMDENSIDIANTRNSLEKDDVSFKIDKVEEESAKGLGIQGLGEISPEAQQYILQLQSRLSYVKKELCEVKRKSDALQMQQFVGEEKNDLLDYLRSLQPEKVAELSEPACAEIKETIHSVVHGLLATLSPKIHSNFPSIPENTSGGAVNVGNDGCTEFVENTSLQFQALITLTRDYLARLLFWCMLLGHYLRGLEYRMELMELLSLTRDAENGSIGEEPVA